MPQKGKKSVGSGIFPHKKHTEETKKKISASCKGLKHSPEAIARRTGGKLIVHHIHNFAYYPELRTSIENGITLTAETHRVFHKKYGYKNNTKEQLDEFLKT